MDFQQYTEVLMSSDDLPQWLAEIGRSPARHQSGRPVPPIGDRLQAKLNAGAVPEFNEAESLRHFEEYGFAVDACGEHEVNDFNARILDAMTENKLSSKQTMQLLTRLFSRFSGTAGLSRVTAAGQVEPLNRWGAA
jgi:hypothetical protein